MLRWFGVERPTTPPGARQPRAVRRRATGARECSMMSQPVIASSGGRRGEIRERPPHLETEVLARMRAPRRSSIPKGCQPRRRATERKRPVPQPTSSSRPGG
jgi:hypothetical protein